MRREITMVLAALAMLTTTFVPLPASAAAATDKSRLCVTLALIKRNVEYCPFKKR